jgi:serine/threonine protein kinase
LDFVRRVVKSLSELHAVGITHGCLCPANVLLDDDLRPVLSEAAAVSVHSLVQRKLDSVGYAAFAAPEVLLGEAPDVRSDVWSAGRLLESLLVGDEAGLVADCLRLCFAELRTARWVSALRLDAALEQVAVRLPSGDVATLPMPSASLAARGRTPSLPGAGDRQPSLPLAARARTPSLPGTGERQPSLPTSVERRASVVDSRRAKRQSSSRGRYGLAVVGVTASLGLAALLGPEAELARRGLVALAVLIVAVLTLAAAIQKWSGANGIPERPSRGPRSRK